MDQKVIVFAGCKQSGKSTAAKYVHGLRMQQAGVIRFFEVSAEGELLVDSNYVDGEGKVQQTVGIFDIYRQDLEFARYAHEHIWPLIRVYSFASALKQTACEVFGLNPQYIYGTDTDKEQPTTIKWGDIWSLLSTERRKEITEKHGKNAKDKFLSHREFLQEFGTLCRIFDPDCWLKTAWRRIREDGYLFNIIDDGRYENEIDYSRSEGARIILLENQPIKSDTHSSEKILSVDKAKFDAIIPEGITMDEKHKIIENLLVKFGWTQTTLGN